MRKRITMITLLVGFVVGGTALFSTVALAHGGTGMMGNQDEVNSQNDEYSGTMHQGDDYDMMGGMMGYRGMGSMMHEGRGNHMMDFDGMRQGGMLNQADKLGLSNDQISKLNTLRLEERKDIIRQKAEANVVRVELSQLVASDHWTINDAAPLVHKISNLEGAIRLRHLQALKDARNILTADQLKLYSSTEQVASSDYYCK